MTRAPAIPSANFSIEKPAGNTNGMPVVFVPAELGRDCAEDCVVEEEEEDDCEGSSDVLVQPTRTASTATAMIFLINGECKTLLMFTQFKREENLCSVTPDEQRHISATASFSYELDR